MLCSKDSGIARGQTLQVARKKCMAQSCFFAKSSEFGQRLVITCANVVESFMLRV